jgi:hypothetical protein
MWSSTPPPNRGIRGTRTNWPWIYSNSLTIATQVRTKISSAAPHRVQGINLAVLCERSCFLRGRGGCRLILFLGFLLILLVHSLLPGLLLRILITPTCTCGNTPSPPALTKEAHTSASAPESESHQHRLCTPLPKERHYFIHLGVRLILLGVLIRMDIGIGTGIGIRYLLSRLFLLLDNSSLRPFHPIPTTFPLLIPLLIPLPLLIPPPQPPPHLRPPPPHQHP